MKEWDNNNSSNDNISKGKKEWDSNSSSNNV